MRTSFNERDIETFIESKLKSLGWIDDIHSDKRNVWKQQPATETQKKKLKGKRADYILYQSGTTNPLIVIEVKKPGEDIYQALEQGVNYAKSIEAPLVFATNGEFTKAYHIVFRKTLTRNGEEVKDFFTEKEALEFVDHPRLITQENKVILSRHELIKIFAEANDLLWKEGLRKGEERFSEFANILFLKIISEIEEGKEKSTVEKKHLWNSWSNERGDNLKSRMDQSLEHFRQKYKEGELFSVSKIENIKILEEIIDKLNPLCLVETKKDVKGEAFEYFLQQYNSGGKDLGEYFTPRHVIRNLVSILQPRFKDKIYDPFCGTGGMLIECFRYVSERVKLDLENIKTLSNCFYGNEITNVARITKMNMILFGDGHNNVQQRDTFQCPVDNKYELVITNIPFGFDDIDWGHLYPINCKYGDCLAIQHCLKACKENGKAAIIMPEGFFTRGNIEKYQETKKWIIDNYSIQAVISLPRGIFLPYTGSKSSIIIVEKKKRTKSYFYYYQVKRDGFTLNNHRERVEGINDWDILVSSWKEVVIEEKTSSPLFTKIYYQDIENNDYDLLFKINADDIIPPKGKEKEYFLLPQVADIFRGPFGSNLKKSDFVINGPYKVYQQEHVIKNDFSLGNRYISEEKYQQLKSYELQTDDILMSFAGTLGKVAIFPKIAEKGVISTALTVIRIKREWKEKILAEYLLAICQTPQMEKALSRTFGTAVQHLRLDNLKRFLVPIPPLEKQKKAVEELSNILKKITASEEEVKTLKNFHSLSLSLLWEGNQG
jgi:type I restriction enzyme M protein